MHAHMHMCTNAHVHTHHTHIQSFLQHNNSVAVVNCCLCSFHYYTYRFSCLQRVYKYYFPQGDMDLEASVCTQVTTTYKALCGTTHVMYRCILAHYPIHVQVMSQAAQKFVGEHDFRNFCKVRLNWLIKIHIL